MVSIIAFLFWIVAQQGPAARAPVRATLSGTTLPSDSSQPLPYVTLKLTPLDDPALPVIPQTGRGGANPTGNYMVTSDALGNFQFTGIAPGRYTISAERSGYLRQEMFQYGPGGTNESILTLSAAQKVEGLILALTSVPTIAGIVNGVDGRGLAGVTVQAYRVQFTPYGRQLVRVAAVLSHEGGEYRLFHLNPGYYYVSASYSAHALQPWKSLLELSPNLSNPDDGYSTIYYPAELKLANAKPINLNSGGVANADIFFKEAQYFKLKIKVILPPSQTPGVPLLQNVRVALIPAGADLGTVVDYVVKGSGDSFSVDRLPEGDYVMVALADLFDCAGNSYTGIASDTVPVRVADNTEATIAAMEPVEIPGSIVRPAGTALPNKMQVQLVRIDTLANQTIVADVDTSGQFRLPGVGPGTYDVFVQGMPRNAYLQGIRFPNSQLLQIRIDANLPPRTWVYSPDARTDCLLSDARLTINLSPTGSSISGRVVDGKGGKVKGAEVVFVPNDPVVRLRKDRYAVTHSDAMGVFQLQGIAPGSYTAYAFEEIESEIYFDPDFNVRMTPLGSAVYVDAGVNRPIDRDLTIITKDDVVRLTR